MKATFGAGCFWCVEPVFSKLKGIKSTTVGYMGGSFPNPTYEDVCTGETGHAEVVQMEYDPSITSYEEILGTFWSNHDPTTPNRQGPDVGEQYRSVVFFHTKEQEETAKSFKERLQSSGKYSKKIVTSIEPAKEFYRAEEYHQQYYKKCGLA